MQLAGAETLRGYLQLLRSGTEDAEDVAQDLLISMTHFFRDPDWFAALFALVPPLFEAKPAGEPVRVWVPACATGAETYSLVMVLLEYARTLKEAPPLQLFGTDLDTTAIQAARTGFYANAIKSHISEARLDRFFTKEPQGIRVTRELGNPSCFLHTMS